MSDKTWSTWGPQKTVTAEMISVFAGLTENRQWIHEPDVCGGPYGRQIAHGFLLLSLIPALLPDDGFAIPDHSVRIVRGFDTLRLPSPVYPGEKVRVRTRTPKAVAAASGKGIIITRDVELWSISGTKPAVSCTLKLQYF